MLTGYSSVLYSSHKLVKLLISKHFIFNLEGSVVPPPIVRITEYLSGADSYWCQKISQRMLNLLC